MNLPDMTMITRIAPSPTGYLHFGLARTALFNYLYARKHDGKFIMRIEDTDMARNKPEYEDDIREQMAWLGLEADAIYRQSEHRPRHEECLKQLIQDDKAYISEEPAKDDASKTVSVVRLRNSGEVITFTDLIRGEITFDTTELKDFVIARSMTEPLYHLAVVIDDNDEGVTHVIRGEDHISNTPRQMLIARALGFKTPVYAHLPLILMPDKSKMSKRKHETSVKYFREAGILPQALVNYVALLGWNPGTDKELFTLPELVDAFEVSHIQKSGAVFDLEKLRWFNRQYLHAMRDDDFADEALRILEEGIQGRGLVWDENLAHKVLPTLKERISSWKDLRDIIDAGEIDFFFKKPTLESKRIPEKKSDAASAKKHLEKIAETLAALEQITDTDSIKNAIWEYATEQGRGAVLWPFRYALTGAERSPDPFAVTYVIGKDEAISRVKAAIEKIDL